MLLLILILLPTTKLLVNFDLVCVTDVFTKMAIIRNHIHRLRFHATKLLFILNGGTCHRHVRNVPKCKPIPPVIGICNRPVIPNSWFNKNKLTILSMYTFFYWSLWNIIRKMRCMTNRFRFKILRQGWCHLNCD